MPTPRLGSVLVASGLLFAACDRPGREPSRGQAVTSAPGASAEGAGGVPSEAECRAAIATMQRLAPREVPADGQDLADCLRLPGSVVRCIREAASRADADACATRYATNLPSAGTAVGPDEPADPVGPESRATADECARVVRHLRGIAAELGTAATLRAQCDRIATRADVNCLLAAKTLAQVRQCAVPGF